MAAMLGPEWPFEGAVVEEVVPVSVTTEPSAPVMVKVPWMVYVIGFPVARGPSVAVLAGAVIVAPPDAPPPMTAWTAAGTS